MNIFSKVFLTGLVLVAVPLCSVAEIPQRDKETKTHGHEIKSLDVKAHHITGKALKHTNAKLLDIKFSTSILSVYRIHKSSSNIKKCLEMLATPIHHKDQKVPDVGFIKTQLDQSLKLVEPFINDIRSYKDLILPLVNESNKNHTITNSYLTRFLNGADALDEFTNKNITSLESLQGLLKEVQAFLLDLLASISKETKDAYKTYIAAETAKQQSNHSKI